MCILVFVSSGLLTVGACARKGTPVDSNDPRMVQAQIRADRTEDIDELISQQRELIRKIKDHPTLAEADKFKRIENVKKNIEALEKNGRELRAQTREEFTNPSSAQQ